MFMNKKIIIFSLVVIILLAVVGIFFIGKKKRAYDNVFSDNTKTSLFCAKEGEVIGATGMPRACCSGFKALDGLPNGYDGVCSKPQPPTGLSMCASCGDGICNNNYEGKCNCPTDCANSVCGKEGESLGGNIDRCCSGLSPKSLSKNGNFGGLSACAK